MYTLRGLGALPSILMNYMSSRALAQVGSLSGEFGLPMRSAYCASKFALHGTL